jgi:hypothetical protein
MRRRYGPVLLLAASFFSACTGPPSRELAFVTPAFEHDGKGGGGVAAVDVASRDLAIVWTRRPEKSGLRPDRALQILFDARRGRLWVGDLDGPGIVALDAATGETVASLPLHHEVVGIALSPDGRRIVTAARDALEAYVLDAERGALEATIATGTIAPETSALPSFFTAHPIFLDDRYALVEDNVAGALVRIDGERRAVDARFEIGSPIHAIDRSPEGRLVAIVEGKAGKAAPRVLVLDPKTGTPGASVEIPLDEGEIPRLHHGVFSRDGRRYTVANMGPLKAPTDGGLPGHTVALVDLSDPSAPKVAKRARAGDGAGHPILSPDERALYVVNHHETFVSVFGAATFEPLALLVLAKAKGFGHGVAWSKEGALLVLASRDGDLVRLAADGTVTRRALDGNLGELEPGW